MPVIVFIKNTCFFQEKIHFCFLRFVIKTIVFVRYSTSLTFSRYFCSNRLTSKWHLKKYILFCRNTRELFVFHSFSRPLCLRIDSPGPRGEDFQAGIGMKNYTHDINWVGFTETRLFIPKNKHIHNPEWSMRHIMNYECQRLFVIFLCKNKKRKEKKKKKRKKREKKIKKSCSETVRKQHLALPPPPRRLLPGTLGWSKLHSGVIFLCVLPKSRFVPPAASPACPARLHTARHPQSEQPGNQHVEKETDWSVCLWYLKHILSTYLITCSLQHLVFTSKVLSFLPPCPSHIVVVTLCLLTEPGGERGDK